MTGKIRYEGSCVSGIQKGKKVDPIGRLALNKDFEKGDTGTRRKNICICTLKSQSRVDGVGNERDRSIEKRKEDMGWVQTMAYSTL